MCSSESVALCVPVVLRDCVNCDELSLIDKIKFEFTIFLDVAIILTNFEF